MKKFKEKSLELIWNEVGSAKFRCGLSSIIGKDYEMYQSWQKRLLEIEEEIIKFNETGEWK